MLAMLLVASALTRVSFVYSKPTDGGQLHLKPRSLVFRGVDLSHELLEMLGKRIYEKGIKKRSEGIEDKYDPPYHGVKSSNTGRIPSFHHPPEEHKKRLSYQHDEVDVVDREDHVTQYLAELLVNTDSEITSLQASETDDDRDGIEVKEDSFFAFLTGLEKAVEVDGVWSRPADDDLFLKSEDSIINLLLDMDYKYSNA